MKKYMKDVVERLTFRKSKRDNIETLITVVTIVFLNSVLGLSFLSILLIIFVLSLMVGIVEEMVIERKKEIK